MGQVLDIVLNVALAFQGLPHLLEGLTHLANLVFAQFREFRAFTIPDCIGIVS